MITFKYLSDEATVKLRNFWKPDGKKVDANNKAKLHAAMTKSGLATGPGRIANLLTGDAFADVRAEIVTELGL